MLFGGKNVGFGIQVVGRLIEDGLKGHNAHGAPDQKSGSTDTLIQQNILPVQVDVVEDNVRRGGIVVPLSAGNALGNNFGLGDYKTGCEKRRFESGFQGVAAGGQERVVKAPQAVGREKGSNLILLRDSGIEDESRGLVHHNVVVKNGFAVERQNRPQQCGAHGMSNARNFEHFLGAHQLKHVGGIPGNGITCQGAGVGKAPWHKDIHMVIVSEHIVCQQDG